VQRLACEYIVQPGQLLDEGFVAVFECPPLAEAIRLKVHTYVWNVVHGWWEDNQNSRSKVSIGSVMPALRDPRFALVGAAAFEPSLLKYRRTEGSYVVDDSLALRFRVAVARAGVCLQECMAELAGAFERTAHMPKGKELVQALKSLSHLTPGQTEALSTFILCARSRIDPALLEACRSNFHRIVCAAYGKVVADDLVDQAGMAGSDTPVEEQELLAALRDQVFANLFKKLIQAWADQAQSTWNREVEGRGC